MAVMHDVKRWIIVKQISSNLLSIIDRTAKWKENRIICMVVNTELIKLIAWDVYEWYTRHNTQNT